MNTVLTVRDLVNGASSPEEITVFVCESEYKILEKGGLLDKRTLNMIGDYVVDDYKANLPDQYCIWVMVRPVQKDEILKEMAGA